MFLTGSFLSPAPSTSRKLSKRPEGSLGLGKLVQTEIDLRKKESLGMAPIQSARKLGTGVPKKGSKGAGNSGDDTREAKISHRFSSTGVSWSCLVCTM